MKTALRIRAAAALLAFTNSALALTVPVAENTHTTEKGIETFIYASSGADVSMPVNAKETALIRFDLNNTNVVPASVAPDTVSNAILRLYFTTVTHAGDLTIHAVTSPWSEHFTGLRTSAPAINPAVLATIPAGKIKAKDFVSVDLTAAVVSALQSGTTDGFAIETSGTTLVAISSKEGPAEGYAAELDIEANGQLTNNNTSTGAGALYDTNGSYNTAIGAQALNSNTFGTDSTAVGAAALQYNISAGFNTAIGTYALALNSGSDNTATGYATIANNSVSSDNSGSNNTANGYEAMIYDSSGSSNTAVGAQALYNCTTDGENVAVGYQALFKDSTEAGPGSPNENVAVGYQALYNNTTGASNTANGWQALYSNITGVANIASGYTALYTTTTGTGNIASGYAAMYNNQTGSYNIAIGVDAGYNLTTGKKNIDIGDDGADVAGEANTIRIGAPGAQQVTYIAGIRGAQTISNDAIDVMIDSNGNLGTVNSSRRFKEDITDMGDASARILRLRPVTFRYKKPYDNGGKPIQYGLIAEEVAQVFPELTVFDAKGQPETVKYHLLATLLLNEFIKAHDRLEAQGQTIAAQEKRFAAQEETIAGQQKQIQALTASLAKVTQQIDTVAQRLDGKDYQPVVNRVAGAPTEQ